MRHLFRPVLVSAALTLVGCAFAFDFEGASALAVDELSGEPAASIVVGSRVVLAGTFEILGANSTAAHFFDTSDHGTEIRPLPAGHTQDIVHAATASPDGTGYFAVPGQVLRLSGSSFDNTPFLDAGTADLRWIAVRQGKLFWVAPGSSGTALFSKATSGSDCGTGQAAACASVALPGNNYRVFDMDEGAETFVFAKEGGPPGLFAMSLKNASPEEHSVATTEISDAFYANGTIYAASAGSLVRYDATGISSYTEAVLGGPGATIRELWHGLAHDHVVATWQNGDKTCISRRPIGDGEWELLVCPGDVHPAGLVGDHIYFWGHDGGAVYLFELSPD